MSASLALVLALLAQPSAQARNGDSRASSCVICHGAEGKEHSSGVHARGGVDCITCHGGVAGELDVAKAHGPSLKKLTDPREAVESCGACHSDVERMRSFGLRTDQLSLYWTSRHGAKLLADDDRNVATCVTCHGSHRVLPVDDPRAPANKHRQVETCGRCHADATRMAAYGLPADVVERYRGSVHGTALIDRGHPAAPACTDCHGSHGAQPPRSGDVEMVCGQCHSVVQDYFDQSPHSKSVAPKSSVQCTSCHGEHSIAPPSAAMLLGDDERHCGSCHTAADDPARAVATQLHASVLRLESTIDDAEGVIRDAGLRGLFLGEERGYLDEARGLLVRARTMTHALSPAALDDVLNRGQAMVQTTLESLATKERALRDRKIFTGVFFGVALACSIALLMYAHEIGGRWKTKRDRKSQAQGVGGGA